ncbi:IclR family transcriptional regulator [Streptomyces sp. NBC_01262]|jgi:DNA-binding IclR family transcriptional regulator|uniref:IclR family transcriptional regulator n=1 Tax=Streptomyces sp. NBC_01262 TaxID=2903803 RepID=UPI002E316B3F|nr:IclR family transcriptional regulator [Streptomyces sp. NBC_01262]
MTSSGRARDTSVQSVDRAVSILQVLAGRGPSGVTEVAEELGIHKATVFRLLATLESRGLVEQDSERGRYRIGHTVVELAAGSTMRSDLSLLSRPVCQELAAAAGETVNVAIHDGPEVISIDQVIGGAAITSIDWVGKRTPMHATAAGKIFLAYMSPDRAQAILAQGLTKYTPHTVVDPARLKEQLEFVRKREYATTSEEHEIGLAAIAAPIRSLDGRVIAAVTLSGPTFRVNEDTIPDLAERVVEAGARISWRKGYVKRG